VSLRTKMMFAVVATMFLVFFLLTLNLWVNALDRVRTEKRNMAEVIQQVTQDWISERNHLWATGDQEAWADFSRRVSRSSLFRDWIVADGMGDILAYDPTMETPPPPLKRDEELTRAVGNDREVVVRGNRVTAPLLLADGQVVALRVNIDHLASPAFDPVEGFKGILTVMALGTVLLILVMYILLKGMIMRPLGTLVEASHRVATGDYRHPLEGSGTYDEIGTLVRAFNQMQSAIREGYETLEQRVEEATDRVRGAERQLVVAQRLSATGTLASGIAHEVNNPLGGMLNAARVLKKDTLSPEKRQEYLDLVIDGLTRIQETVRTLLQFTPRKPDPRPISIVTLFERSLTLVAHRMETKRILMKNLLPPDLPQVYADGAELQQVFLNLISNAIDAIDHGFGVLTVAATVAENDLTAIIADNGCGMTPDQVAHAFDAYFTTKKEGEGSGLGLFVVQNIIQAHGGRVAIESEQGVGTKLKVTLPLYRETGPAPRAAAPPASVPGPTA